jgi:hypothetical protein
MRWNDLGQHQPFTNNGVPAYYCWIDSIGGLTDASSDGVINTFSHELAETCTDPNLDAFHVNGKQADGTVITGDEIGDTCNKRIRHRADQRPHLQCAMHLERGRQRLHQKPEVT